MPDQVINRDLSIAVLRHFVQQRREEIAAGKFKRPRTQQKPPAASASAVAAPNEASASGQPSMTAGGPGEKQRRPPYVPYKPPQDIRILEGLAASGLRSIRYALEVRFQTISRHRGLASNLDIQALWPEDDNAVVTIMRGSRLQDGRAAMHARQQKKMDRNDPMCVYEELCEQIDGVARVDANDLDEAAAEAVRRNLQFNDTRAAAIVRPSQGDVRAIAIQVCDIQAFPAT